MKKYIIALGLAAFAMPVFAQDTSTMAMPEDTTMPSMPMPNTDSSNMSDTTNMNMTDTTSAPPVSLIITKKADRLVAFVQDSPAVLKVEGTRTDEAPAYTEGE